MYIFSRNPDTEFANLSAYTGSLQDRQFYFLGDLGYTGALEDRFKQWRDAGMPTSLGGPLLWNGDQLQWNGDDLEFNP